MARIELWNGDICDLEVDAIVSPANTSLWMSAGVAGELKRTGGDQIEFAAIRQGPARLGDAIVTEAGALAAKVVVHAVSLERDRRTSAAAIEAAVRSAMARVRELGLASVAFPALGSGIGGFPLDDAARITVHTVRDELAAPSSIEHVVFALRGAAPYHAFAAALSAVDPEAVTAGVAEAAPVRAASPAAATVEAVEARTGAGGSSSGRAPGA